MKVLDQVLLAHKLKHEVDQALDGGAGFVVVLHDHMKEAPKISVLVDSMPDDSVMFEVHGNGITVVDSTHFTGSVEEAEKLVNGLLAQKI